MLAASAASIASISLSRILISFLILVAPESDSDDVSAENEPSFSNPEAVSIVLTSVCKSLILL